MINAENLTKSFGRQILFEAASFKINPRERVGLVGRNGHGKTTLVRMIVGESEMDGGGISIPKNYRLGYVRQQIAFEKETVLEEGMRGLPETEKDHYWKVEKILAGLGFSEADLRRNPMEFSGGYQVRLNLAKVLVSDPDLLLLDEPTNYLDITSIRWIQRFLINWPRALLLITHDRGFMDRIVTHTLGIHRRKIRKIAGDTAKYYAQMAQDEEIYEKTRLNDARRRKEIELFISRFRAKARLANLVQSRVKTLAKMEKRERLERLKNLEFSFRSKPFPGKHMMAARQVCFSYEPNRLLIKNFSIGINAGDRICVVGPNGKGKTTLLKLLAGTLTPRSGEITRNPNLIEGVFEQTNLRTLDDAKTVEEEILSSHGDVDRQKARNICGAMMFAGNDALKKIRVLSGGEKSRVMLGRVLATPVNLLFLDEPTNHLDMESCDALLAAIDSFEGAVVMVTHNEMFLHALAERLIVFHDNRIRVFEDGYQRFLEKGGWGDDMPSSASAEEAATEGPTAARLSKKQMRRKRSEINARRTASLKPIEETIARTENDIESREKELGELHAAMQTATQAQDGQAIGRLARSIHRCQEAIDRLFKTLETSTEALEKERAQFDLLVKELDE